MHIFRLFMLLVLLEVSTSLHWDIGRQRILERRFRLSKGRVTLAYNSVLRQESSNAIEQISSRLLPKLFEASKLDQTTSLKNSTESVNQRINELAASITLWEQALIIGTVPGQEVSWPKEPLKGEIKATLIDLNVPRLVMLHPDILTSVLIAIIQMAIDYNDRVRLFEDSKKQNDSTEAVPEDDWFFDRNLSNLSGESVEDSEIDNPLLLTAPVSEEKVQVSLHFFFPQSLNIVHLLKNIVHLYM